MDGTWVGVALLALVFGGGYVSDLRNRAKERDVERKRFYRLDRYRVRLEHVLRQHDPELLREVQELTAKEWEAAHTLDGVTDYTSHTQLLPPL